MPNRVFQVQKMSQKCIIARNDLAHFESLKALEVAVRSSETAIMTFPVLMKSHPDQCHTIKHYWSIKKFLPESFK